MPLLVRKRQLAIEQEAAEGVAETLVIADVQFGVEELDSTFTPEPQDRNPMRATLSHDGVVIGASFGEITGRTELKQRVSGDPVTTVPPFHDLYLAAGMAEAEVKTVVTTAGSGTFTPGEHITGDAGTPADIYCISSTGTLLTYVLRSGAQDVQAAENLTGDDSGADVDATVPTIDVIGVAYHPVSASVPSFTAGDYMDGVANTLFGARLTGGINVGGVGQLGYLTFTLQGAAVAPVDAALFAGTTIPDITPEVFLSANVNADGVALCIDSFALDFANTLARRNCANRAAGIVSYRITDRLPTIAIDPERELEATTPFFTNFGAGTRFGFEATIGTSAGLKTIIVAGRCQYTELPGADREGISILNAGLRLNAASADGDDEFFICHV